MSNLCALPVYLRSRKDSWFQTWKLKNSWKKESSSSRSTTLELWASAAKSQLRSKLVSGNTCSKSRTLLDQAYGPNGFISFGVAHRNTTATKEILGTDRQLSCRGRLLSRKMILIWLSAARGRSLDLCQKVKSAPSSRFWCLFYRMKIVNFRS